MNEWVAIGIIILGGWLYTKWWSNNLMKIIDEKMNSQVLNKMNEDKDEN